MDWWDKIFFKILNKNEISGGGSPGTARTSCHPLRLPPREGLEGKCEGNGKRPALLGSNRLQRPGHGHGPERGPRISELAISLLDLPSVSNL